MSGSAKGRRMGFFLVIKRLEADFLRKISWGATNFSHRCGMLVVSAEDTSLENANITDTS